MKICLCGSTRFRKQWMDANARLTLAGHVVYSVAMMTHALGEDQAVTVADKAVLDAVHMQKILESDVVVLVSDETGYFGESTQRELAFAQISDKTVYESAESFLEMHPRILWLEPLEEDNSETA